MITGIFILNPSYYSLLLFFLSYLPLFSDNIISIVAFPRLVERGHFFLLFYFHFIFRRVARVEFLLLFFTRSVTVNQTSSRPTKGGRWAKWMGSGLRVSSSTFRRRLAAGTWPTWWAAGVWWVFPCCAARFETGMVAESNIKTHPFSTSIIFFSTRRQSKHNQQFSKIYLME